MNMVGLKVYMYIYSSLFIDIDSTPLYSGSYFTIDVTLVMILMFSLRHSLSYEAISDLLRLIKTLCPNPNGIPRSFWCFRKRIKTSCTIMPKSCSYCSQCFDNISDPSVLMCPTCNSENKPQSFTILPIDNQISSLFKSKMPCINLPLFLIMHRKRIL